MAARIAPGATIRARRALTREEGSAVAEVAVLMPALLVILALCLAGVRVATTQLLLQDAAADAARSVARGDPPRLGAERVARAAAGATLTRRREGGMVCVAVSAPAPLRLRVAASSCAWEGGR
ncbi:MAG: pilus assembly protein [Micrococcales bacterium]|nr:pilus assembly protein [Micrococcales bacterium]